MIDTAYRWRFVLVVVAMHVVIEAGSTFLTWHAAIGPDRWTSVRVSSYESLALYAKLAVGVCTTVLQLKDNSWSKAKEGTPA
jgi:hypothetical protein